MSRTILLTLQSIFSILLLLLVCYQSGLFTVAGRSALLSTLADAHIGWLLLSILVGVLINLCSAFKWFALLRARQLVVGFGRTFVYYLIGQFYNQLLPTSVGGDVVRSYQMGSYVNDKPLVLASVFVERYTGVLVLLLLAAISTLWSLSTFNAGFIWFSLAAFVFILGGLAWVVLDVRWLSRLEAFFVPRFASTKKWFDRVDKILQSVHAYGADRRSLFIAFLNSLLFYFVAALNIYVTARVFSADIALLDILIATPVIMLIMNIPLSVGNIGLMEFAYVNVFQIFGYAPELALSVALLMRLKSLFDGVMGGLLQLLLVTPAKE